MRAHNPTIDSISVKCGTFFNTETPDVKTKDAIIGKAAFFAPDTKTWPVNGPDFFTKINSFFIEDFQYKIYKNFMITKYKYTHAFVFLQSTFIKNILTSFLC